MIQGDYGNGFGGGYQGGGFGSGLGSGLGGGLGGIAGSYFGNPMLGAQLGQTIGGLAGGLADSYFNRNDPRRKAMQESQDELLAQLRQQGQYDFDPIAQRETTRFNQEILPGIAERFSSMGGQRSSAFRQQLAGAGGDLAERLAALGAGHQLQAGELNQRRLGALQNFLGGQQNLAQQNYQFGQNQGLARQQLGLQGQGQQQQYSLGKLDRRLAGLGLGLGRQYEPIYNARRPGFVEGLAGSVPAAAQAGARAYAGGL